MGGTLTGSPQFNHSTSDFYTLGCYLRTLSVTRIPLLMESENLSLKPLLPLLESPELT